jgi:hypothetical protein
MSFDLRNSALVKRFGVGTMMRRPALAALACSILLTVAACQIEEPSAPQSGGSNNLIPVPSLPTSNANLNCSYTPSGDISIPVNQTQTFVPSDITDCNGAYGVLTPMDGRVGFNAAPCVVYQTQEIGPANLFKARRCTTGPLHSTFIQIPARPRFCSISGSTLSPSLRSAVPHRRKPVLGRPTPRVSHDR